MTAKLFTIGDSISQGFMSGSAANTHQSFSTIIAETIHLDNYRYLKWDDRFKTKINLELILRTLEKDYGTNIRGLEWLGVLPKINKVLDIAEDYFERGEGRLGNPVEHPSAELGFHNVAVEGMDVGDAYSVTPNICKGMIQASPKSSRKDGFMSSVSCPFYRNAYRVLNPLGQAGESEFGDYTAIKWMEHTAKREGIENAILMLGANNALGTVLDLNVKMTPNAPEQIPFAPRPERLKFNLWHPEDFEAEYREMLDKFIAAMASNMFPDWKVFVGNVPLVTIAPIAKGIGEHRLIKDPSGDGRDALYYQYYTYFPLTEKSAKSTGKYLKFRDALFIDKTIIKYNEIIARLLKEMNDKLGEERFILIDICDRLRSMAWKRNLGNPTYQFPKEFEFIYPPIDTKYYHVNRNGLIEKGGVFSLDGVHPSAIGQGLIAWEFLNVMKEHRPELKAHSINWQSIIAQDSLRHSPIKLMSEIYEHDKLVNFLASVANILNIRD